MSKGYRIQASTGIHRGDRDYQQDQVCLLNHPRHSSCMLAVLADGMGGRSGGRKASDQVMLTARQLFERYDVLVSASVPITATPVDAREVQVGEQCIDVRAAVLSYTSAWNLTGLPAISLPVGQVRGMPVGLQVIGAAGEDDRLLQVVAQRSHLPQ